MKKQIDKFWNSKSIDAHRRGISDVEWANCQPDTPPKYIEGDVVEFMVGGYGIIDEVSFPENGNPSQYSIRPIAEKKFHPKGIYAWHYEGDIKRLVEGSAIRRLTPNMSS